MKRPLSYRQIAADVHAGIRAGEFPPGAAIPSYRQLSRSYGVSLSTVRLAVRLLRAHGVVYGLTGRGVFVARQPRARRTGG
jgi:GntR family transcriptional regulator